MRLVFFADLHLNKQVQPPIHKSGYPQRVIDLYNNLVLVIDFAIENEVDYLLFGGDAYETARPLEEYRHMFRSEIVRAATAGITCVLIPGNHDMTKRQTADHALAEFRDLPLANIHLVDKPTLLEFEDLNIYALPWQYGKFDAPEFKCDKFTVCIAHCTVLGAVFQSGQTITTLDKDFGVELDFFKQFDLALIGHIHRPQVLSEVPFVGYPGSSEWLTWGEIGAYHGWYYYDSDLGKVQHLHYEHRPRYDYDWSEVDDIFKVDFPVLNPEAMYRIKVKDLDADVILKKYEKAFELKIVRVITREQRRPDVKLDPKMTMRELFIAYKGQDWNDEIAEMYDEIEKEVRGENELVQN